MDWRAKVELFEEIRREYEFGVGTIAGVAKKLKVHRRMVREAIGSALPKPRKSTERPRWKLASAIPLWLAPGGDESAFMQETCHDLLRDHDQMRKHNCLLESVGRP